MELKKWQDQVDAGKETFKKYRELKTDYKELLETFERSEEIRHEQKEMINDQKQQVKALKGKVKLQDEQMQEMRSKTRYLEVMLEAA